MSDQTARIRIVVVEDNAADVHLVKEALHYQKIAFDMTCYPDADVARAAFADATKAAPDVILLDLNLPRGDGLGVLRQIRGAAHLANVPVGILTSSESPFDHEQALKVGVDKYIHKPINLHEFLESVGKAVEGLLSQRRRAHAQSTRS